MRSAIARYFFDVLTADGLLHDEDGLELTSPDAVKTEVARIVSDIARDEIADSISLTVTVDVRDGRDVTIFRGTLAFDSGWIDPS